MINWIHLKELVFIIIASLLILGCTVSADYADFSRWGKVGFANEDALWVGKSDELAVYLQVGAMFFGLVLFEGDVKGSSPLCDLTTKASDQSL